MRNVEQRQAAANPQTKPPDLGCESACRLLSSTTTVAIYYEDEATLSAENGGKPLGGRGSAPNPAGGCHPRSRPPTLRSWPPNEKSWVHPCCHPWDFI